MAFFFLLLLLFFWLNYSVAPARHQGLKVLSEARSLPLECLTPGGGYVVEGTMRWVGEKAELRQSLNLFPVIA